MAYYMVRVELFGASSDDYERLHANMDAMGIEREVTFNDGTRCEMPSGSYYGSSHLDLQVVRDKIRAFANPLSPQKSAAVFVCEAKENQWSAFLYLA